MPDTPAHAAIEATIDWPCPHGGTPWRYRFSAPLLVLEAHAHDQVMPLLQAVHAHALAGRWCIGCVAYEAAPAFDRAFAVHTAITPLAWFAIFEQAQPWPPAAPPQPPSAQAHWVEPTDASAPHTHFQAQIARIHQDIAAGTLYQVNLTSTLHGRLTRGTPANYFHALQQAQPHSYAAFIDAGPWQLLSVSPELFFDCNGQRILCRPMKGTAPRGPSPEEDARRAQALRQSPKERAENVMIVDLIRNDLARVAQPWSVTVPELFALQALPSVWQMTSDVSAQLRPGLSWVDAFAALFPCGSITGAPKIKSMQTLCQLEPHARGFYCGAIGVVAPAGAARFSVGIRSVSVQGPDLRCGIGSGITASASASAEWQEWQHKRQFLHHASPQFELLETLALENGQLRDAQAHWHRLQAAAAHFGWPWTQAQHQALIEQSQALCAAHPLGHWRVRCLLNAQGQLRMQAQPHDPNRSQTPVQLIWAREPFLQAHSEFVRFKTTHRAHYEAANVNADGVFDTLLYNTNDEITECVRGNIAAFLDGRWVTPALHCGLLPGIGRAMALASGRMVEGIIHRKDAPRVQHWAFINSLRGWLEADLVDEAEKLQRSDAIY